MSAFLDYLRFSRGTKLFQVIFHVTRKCNSRCLSCFSWRRTLSDSPELELSEIRKITSSMPQFPWLMLSGGEPFLREDLPEIVTLFYQNNDIRHVTIPTNALMPDRTRSMIETICTSVPEATVNLVLSIDGIGSEHDRLRGCPKNFEKLIETWKAVGPLRQKLANLSIKFHTVLSNQNYTHFEQIRDFVKELNPDLHTFDFLRGAPADESMELPPEDSLPKLTRDIKEVLRYYGGYERLRKHHSLLKNVHQTVTEEYYDEFLKILREQRQTIPCVASRMTLVIGESGDVSLCEMLPPFGSFREFNYDFDALWNSEAARSRRADIAAKNCHCYHPCYQTVNVLFRPRSVVRAIVKQSARKRGTSNQ